jgi:hypothetical protein
MQMSKIVAFVILFLNSVVAIAQAKLSGVVLDNSGNPVPVSVVEAVPVIQDGLAGSFHWTSTDQRGRFQLTLYKGRYQIRAKNESEGYPDPNFLLGSDPVALFPEVDVAGQDISGLEVRLGSRGGILEGDLREARTLRQIPNGKISICDIKRREVCVELSANESGHFQFTVPGRPVVVSAGATGYKTAPFDRGAPVTLSGGVRRQIEIELEHK